MKRILFILIACLLTYQQAHADAWTVTRNSCWGFLSYRFHAYAQTSVFSTTKYQTGYDCIGRWMGTGTFGSWGTLCNNNSKGCSRPRTATCGPNSGYVSDRIWSGCYLLFSGSHYYYAYARAQNLTSGTHVTRNSSGRGSAGQTGDFLVDEQRLNALNTDGFSQADVSGHIDIENNRRLVVRGLTGVISIARDADFFSNLKIIVIKEKSNLSREEELYQDSLLSVGIFNKIVYSAEITITKEDIQMNGIFSMNNNGIRLFQNGDSIGVRLQNFSIESDLRVAVEEGEQLTVITYSDGGLDLTSALAVQRINLQQETASQPSAFSQISIFPNPAQQFINCEIFSSGSDNVVRINSIDVTGRVRKELYTSPLYFGKNILNNIDISSLPTGMNVLEIITNEGTTYHKIVVK